MIDFLIFYEVGVREFESIALLGYELKKRGYSVEYLGFQQTDFNKYIKYRKMLKKYYNNVDTAIMPSLYNNKEIYNTVYYVCGRCKHIVNLRWEQYFENSSMDDLKCAWFPVELAKKVYHLCWGRRSQASLLERGIEKRLIPITGAIQMDFLREEFKQFYESRNELFEKFGLDNKRKTILYISSFATATMTKRLQAKVEKDFNGEYGFREDTFEFHRKSYEITIDWIEKYLSVHPEMQFIYRPHPAENITHYITKLKKYNNFHIVSERSVKQWIICCDTITTWVSTSIAEAFFAGKNCYIIRPLPYPKDIDICIYNGARFIDSLDAFLNMEENDMTSINPSVFSEYYFTDIKPAYVMTANCLEKVKSTNETFQWDERLDRDFDKRRRSIFIRNLAFIIYYYFMVGLMKVQDKTRLRFCSKIQVRIEGIKATRTNEGIKKPEVLDEQIKRIELFMNR